MSLQLKPFAMMSSTQVTEGAAGLQLSLCTAPGAQPPCAADPLQPSTNSWQTGICVTPSFGTFQGILSQFYGSMLITLPQPLNTGYRVVFISCKEQNVWQKRRERMTTVYTFHIFLILFLLQRETEVLLIITLPSF